MIKTSLLFFAFLFCVPFLLHSKIPDKSHTPNHNMVFIENKGQITDQYGTVRNDIDFSLKDRRMNLFVSAGKIHYQFRSSNDTVHGASAIEQPGGTEKTNTYTVYRLDMELVGARFDVRPVYGEALPALQHFYINGGAVRDVRSYDRITYKEVYPGIDWEIYLRDGKLKYDFILQPGADPSRIRIKYSGAAHSYLSENGSLHIETPLGSITEDAPVAWTAKEGKSVTCSFVQKGQYWGFATESYSGSLILDPGLGWGTYFGGSGMEGMNGTMFLCTEKTAPYNLYFTSETESTDRIATTGAHQTTLKGSTDAFLAKMTPEGKLLWSTYFGGSEDDISTSVSPDKFGNVYIAGSTTSSGIATPGAHNTVYHGGPYGGFNTYMAAFDSSGRLKWATYYGMAGGDSEPAYVAAGSDGSVYLCSSTQESAGISTPGAFKERVNDTWGVNSAFVVRFDSTGKRIWGTYYGGAGTSGGTDGYTLTEGGMALDEEDNIFIFGSADAGTNFDFAGGHQPKHAGGSYDCFLGKLDKDGKHQWGTYWGTTDEDRARAVCTDHDGNVYVSLLTLGFDNLGTAGTSRPMVMGSEFMGDFALAKFNASGKQEWCTYIGPEKGPALVGKMSVDACNNLYLCGYSMGLSDIKPTPDALQPDFLPMTGSTFGYNGVLYRYASMDGTLQYSTFYGPSATQPAALTTDPVGTVYMSGISMMMSDSGIATEGAYQTKLYGDMDMFVSQFLNIEIDPGFSDTLVCVEGTFELPFVTAGVYKTGNEVSVEMSDLPGEFSYTNPVIIGTVSATGSGTMTCTLPSTARAGEVYRIRLRASDPEVIGSCWRTITVRQNGEPAEINIDKTKLGTTQTYVSYQWYFNGEPIPGATDSTYIVTENGDYSVVVKEENGCIDSSNVYTVNNLAISSKDRLQAGILVYPNPVNNNLYIKSGKPYHLVLSDIAGRRLLQSDDKVISLKDLADGTYMIELSDQRGRVVWREKIVKSGR